MTTGDKTTILLVDDEPNVLSALRRALRREGWTLLLASSGQEGLDLLAEHQVAAVVSDIRMPGMDGMAFLERVKDRYPDIARIVLTGFAERATVAMAIERAGTQQMITKPWDDDELKEILRDVVDQQRHQEATSGGLQRIINEVDALPSLPSIYLEVRQLIEEEEDPSAERVAKVIVKDQAIVTKVLQVANTAFFGQRRHIESVSRALIVLGMDFVGKIVLSASVFRSFAAEGGEIVGFEQELFWEHSIACGAAARQIAKTRTLDRTRLEEAMLAGMLHDMGKLVFTKCCRALFEEVIEIARARETVLVDVEAEMLHTTHAAAGAYLADWWSFPPQLVEAIRWHHDPAGSAGHQELAAVVHLADVLANRVEIGESGNGRHPDAILSAVGSLGIGSSALEGIEGRLRADRDTDG